MRVPAEAGRAVGPASFKGLDLAGKAVLVHTGWSLHWRTDRYFEVHPFLTEHAARCLRVGGAALVGIESLNIDDSYRPVHTTLLAARIPIAEHLTHLEQLPDGGYKFFAVSVKVRGFGTFPVRAFGVVPNHQVD